MEGDVDLPPSVALSDPFATPVAASTDNVYLAWRDNGLENEELFLQAVQPMGLALVI